MTAIPKISRKNFFFKPVAARAGPFSLAQDIVRRSQSLASAGINLQLTQRPLPIRLSTIAPQRLSEVIQADNIQLAHGIVGFVEYLGSEVKGGDYNLLSLMAEVGKLPLSAKVSTGYFNNLERLLQRGMRFSDMPANPNTAFEYLKTLSRKTDISPEYLLGNLRKSLRLIELLGVRNTTLNLNMLFHNFQNGFLEVGLADHPELTSAEILGRAQKLNSMGIAFNVFCSGDWNKKLASLNTAEIDSLVTETASSHQVSEGEYRRFISAMLSSEEKRLEAAPSISIANLLTFFKFQQSAEMSVAIPPARQFDDPLRWTGTELGRALRAMRKGINWDAVSVGVREAGDFEALKTDPNISQNISRLRALVGESHITLPTVKGKKVTHEKLGALTEDQILFNLYVLAVLKKEKLGRVIEAALDILEVVNRTENPDPQLHLDEFISSRLDGESYHTLLGTQGVILTNLPIVSALEKLRGLSANLTINVDGRNRSIEDVSVDEFRRAIIMMETTFREPHSPQRILGVLEYRVVPEINGLPKQVIDQTKSHDLGRIVEMAISGIPARYPLRRPWTKVNLDNMAFMGSGLEPGVRNCLGCPINVFVGTIFKTALAMGFDEVIKYESTGCHEVYSGIWPFTGNKFPTFHGVFGGTPSEILGGLAAKKARLKYAQKLALEIAQFFKILHFGIGGDGATFDIGFGNLSGLYSRLQELVGPELAEQLVQVALYVCYDNEGYQNTGNQFSAATPPGGNTTTYPQGMARPLGSDLRKKPIVEIMATHGIPLSARMNIHRPEHISRVTARAMEDGVNGAFLHILQPCTTGWKFRADNIAYDLAYLAEDGGLFTPLTFEHGIPYLEVYPTPRNPERGFLDMQARFKHLTGSGQTAKEGLPNILAYYRSEWIRNLRLGGFDGEIPGADRFNYLEPEHRRPKINV